MTAIASRGWDLREWRFNVPVTLRLKKEKQPRVWNENIWAKDADQALERLDAGVRRAYGDKNVVSVELGVPAGPFGKDDD